MSSRLLGAPPLVPRSPTLDAALSSRARAGGGWLVFHLGEKTETVTAPEAWLLARRWAAALREAGTLPGDRVLVLMPNAASFVGAFFGAGLLGATPVPVAWPFAPTSNAEKIGASLGHVLSVAKPRVVATTPQLEAMKLDRPIVLGPAERPLDEAELAPSPAAPAFIQLTSGTSGAPRGAVISQAAALYSATAMAGALGLEPGQVGLSWLPLFHDMGLVGALLSSLVSGVELHVMTPHEFLLHPHRWLRLASDLRARVLVAPNFGYELALRRAPKHGPFDLSAVEVMLDGSEPVQRTTMSAFEDVFAPHHLRPGAFRPAYGLAEATLGVTFTSAAPDPDLIFGGRVVPSVGRPLAGMEVVVRDDQGAPVPLGTEGEVTVRGPSVMSGYFEDPAATSGVLRGEWLHTGDLGVVDNGALYITGRKKDLIIKAGEKFHPYEIERIASLAVDAGPNAAAAVGRANAKSGTEDLVVLVELPTTRADGAEAKIRGALLAELGVRADQVLVVRPGELPRTTSGKMRRAACLAIVEAHT